MAYREDFKFEIVRNIATLSDDQGGWTKELNLVSFNDAPPKYDLRAWSPDHLKMGKGISLSKDEMAALQEALEKLEL